MKNKNKKKLLATIIAMMFTFPAHAENKILQNEYVRAGVNESTGTLGSGGSTSPGLLYDSTGTGTFNTSYDYLTPGSPFEGFSVKVLDSSNNSLYSLVNNNTGAVNLSGGAWVGTPTANEAVWQASNSDLILRNTYSLPAGIPYIDITTRIDALTAMPHLYFSRFIDPDARAAAGDSSATDNVIGYGAVPASNVVFSEALSSRYALGLYSAASNSRTAVTRWTTDPTTYYTNTVPNTYSGTTYGRGDDTIGIAFYVSGLNAGDYATFRYAYIFGPSAFAAASSAISSGAGGGTANVVPGGGTLTDVGSATSAATSTSSTVTVTGTSTTNTVSNVDVAGTAVVTTSTGTATVTTAGLESQSVQTTTVTTYTPITRTTTSTPVTVTTYSNSSVITTTGTATITSSDVSTTSITATTTTITETIRHDLPVITASLVQHQASETSKVQTIARETTTSVTTPINRNSRSTVVTDGTTASDTSTDTLINNVDTTVTNESFSGRIDQMARLSKVDRLLDRSTNFDAFRKDGYTDGNVTVYLNGGATETVIGDNYATSNNNYGMAVEKKINDSQRMGIQYNMVNTNQKGTDSSTSQNKFNTGIYSIYNTESGYTIVNNLGYSKNNIKSNRSVQGEFTNNHGTKGTNLWLNNRAYLPAQDGVRPFVGVTAGSAATDGYRENGSIQSARTVAKVADDYVYGELGFRYDTKVKDFALAAEIGSTTDGVTSGKFTLGYAPTENGIIALTVGTQNYKGTNINSAALQGTIRF